MAKNGKPARGGEKKSMVGKKNEIDKLIEASKNTSLASASKQVREPFCVFQRRKLTLSRRLHKKAKPGILKIASEPRDTKSLASHLRRRYSLVCLSPGISSWINVHQDHH